MTNNTFGYKPCGWTVCAFCPFHLKYGHFPVDQGPLAASAAPGAPRVGSRQSQAATAAQHAAGSQHQAGGNWNPATTEPTAIIALANCLARSGTARCARQSTINGPK